MITGFNSLMLLTDQITRNVLKTRMDRVDNINAATSAESRAFLENALHNWMDGIRAMGGNTGRLIILSDMVQMERGNDGPMCGGVFLHGHPLYIKPDDSHT